MTRFVCSSSRSAGTAALKRGVVAVSAACTACGACIVTCPEGALVRAARRPALLAGRCTGCLACLEICPAGAISEVGA